VPDEVRITAPGVDLGFGPLGFGEPTNPSTMDWNLHHGSLTPSDSYCAEDNRYHVRSLNEWTGTGFIGFAPWTSNRIGQVKVQLQTLTADGSWNVVGHKTVSVAE
jgi:hypothetical protein